MVGPAPTENQEASMSHTLRRTLLAALVATVAGLSLADAAFAQSKGGNDRGGGVSRGGGHEGGTDAAFDIYGTKASKPVLTHVPPTHNRKPRRWFPAPQVSCEVDGDLEIYNGADRRKCNTPTKRMRQAYLSCETIYIAVPGGYVPRRVCGRGE
jgi:hypothetical protein